MKIKNEIQNQERKRKPKPRTKFKFNIAILNIVDDCPAAELNIAILKSESVFKFSYCNI